MTNNERADSDRPMLDEQDLRDIKDALDAERERPSAPPTHRHLAAIETRQSQILAALIDLADRLDDLEDAMPNEAQSPNGSPLTPRVEVLERRLARLDEREGDTSED